MNIYVVRHGQTEYNVRNIFQGHTDVPLNDVGIAQAKETAEKFRDTNIDLMLVSPLKRAKQTASYINEIVKSEMIIDERLIERFFGDMEGHGNREDWNIRMMLDYNKNYTKENIEPVQGVFKRIFDFLDDITQKYKDKNIVLVTHAVVSIPIECYFNGMPDILDYEHLDKLALKNCEVRRYNK